jgi:hypothetical protein
MARVVPFTVVAIVALGAAPASLAGERHPPTLSACPKRGAITLGAKLAAERNVTYDLDGADLRVCVDKALYPTARKRGHIFMACFQVGVGNKVDRFCGEGTAFADVAGYRIHVALRTKRYSAPSEVWLMVDRPPRAKPPTP